MCTKDAVLDMIRKLPEEATVDDIMYQLYVRQKVEEGLRELDAGEGIPHDEVKKEVAQWLTK